MPAEIANDYEASSVFIVDPDEALARHLDELLSARGAHVRTFATAAAVLDAGGPSPACIISEIDLPDMNGIELIGRLRSRGIEAPVILLAAEADVATAVKAMRAGALDFIEKPHVDRLLAWHVGRLLENAGNGPDPQG